MHFVDQGWSQVDLVRAPKRGRDGAPTDSVCLTAQHGPSLHAFTPRVRVLIQCHRIHKRLKLSELARLANVPARTLRDIEDGVAFPSSGVLEALQETLNVHLVPGTARADGSEA